MLRFCHSSLLSCLRQATDDAVPMDLILQQSAWFGLALFLGVICALALYHGRTLFLQRHGWSHRWAGAALLSWFVLGCYLLYEHAEQSFFTYNLVLGLLGITTTLTAARDFPHKYIRNEVGQSGTLAQKAIVTQAEMMEHAFYQGLNVCQVLYLQFLTGSTQDWPVSMRFVSLFVVSAPWYVRRQFPVHSFSNNWKHVHHSTTVAETIMYKVKKWQYVFYKHVILHGLNITVCVEPHRFREANQIQWQLFWICLNTAYVLEFFLQSLVKRKILAQSTMLCLNQWLMLVSSIAALHSVLQAVIWPICLASVVLNFSNRHHDVMNTMAVAGVAYGFLGLI